MSLILFLLGLFLLGIVAPLILIRIDSSRDWFLDRSLQGSVFSAGVRARVDEVDRLNPSGFVFRGVELQRRSEITAGEWVRWLRVDRMAASWKFLDIISGQWTAGDIKLTTIELNLDEMPHSLLVEKSTPTRLSLQPRLPSVGCERLALEDLRVARDGDAWLTGRLRLRDLEHDRGEVRVYLEEGTVRSIPDSLDLTLSNSWIEGTLLSYLEVDGLQVSATGLEGRLGGTVIAAPAGSTSVSLDGELVFSRMEPTRIPPLANLALPWKETDRFSGRILFGGELAEDREPHADLVMGMKGQIFGARVDTVLLLADWAPNLAEVLDFDLQIVGQRIRGEGQWRPKEKTAEGRLEFVGLDASRLPTSAFVSDLPRSHLSGVLIGRADSLMSGTRVDAELRIEGGTLLDQPLGDLVAQLRVDPANVWIDTLWTGTKDVPTLSAQGRIIRSDPQEIDLTGSFADLLLESWVDPWIDQKLEGRVRGPFRIHGRMGQIRAEASLEVREGRVVEIFVDSLRVEAEGTLQPPEIDAPFQAWGLDFYGFTIDSLRAEAFLADTMTTRVLALRDTTRILLEGRVTPTDPGVAFIDRLRAEPGRGPSVEMVHPTELRFSSKWVEIDSVRMRGTPGDLWGRAWIEPRPGHSGEAPFDFELRGRDIDLAAVATYLGLPPESMSGRADIDFNGQGQVDAPSYQASIDAERSEVYGWLWKTIHLDLEAGAIGSPQVPGSLLGALPAPGSASMSQFGMVQIDSLHALAHGYVGNLPRLGPQRTGPEPPGPPLQLRTVDTQILADRTWRSALRAMAHDSLFVVLENARYFGDISVDNLPLAPILAPILVPQAKQGSQTTFAVETVNPMLSRIRIEKPLVDGETARASRIGGRVSFNLQLDGRGSDPSLRMRGIAEDVQVYQAWADSVDWTAQFVDSLLYIQQLDWTQKGRGMRISGRVPLALSVDPAHTHWRDQPLWLEAEIPSVDLSLVSLATALIEDPSGNLFGRARLKGVPPNVYLEGDLTVNNGAFRIPLREERLSQVSAHLHLDSLGVHFEDATGRWNGTGTATASGWFRDENRFALTGTVEDAVVFETGNYRFVADGEFEAAPVAVGDSLRPRLSGSVRVQEGSITMDLAHPGRQTILDTPWLIDLDVELASDIRVIQPTSSIDLAGGPLQIRYAMPFWSLGGRLDVVEGQYLIFNKDLEITQGSIEFLDTGTGPYPVLDMTATTEVGDPNGDRAILIEIDVDGCPLPGEAMEIVVSSSSHSDYSQEDLIDLLTIGQLRGGNFASGSSSDPARGFLTGQVLNQIERELIREAPWLDMVHLRGGTDSTDPIVISLRAIREPQWSVKYSQELTTNPGREVAFSYRISNLFFLNAVADQREDDLGAENETYSLDLRWRFDY